jgi:hypothetical protein
MDHLEAVAATRRSCTARLCAALLLAITLCAASTAAASAKSPTSLKIPGNFVYVSHVADERCYWGVGVEYPSIPKAVSYTIKYFDGYYNAEETGSQTVPVPGTKGMTPGMNYFGITGGGGPEPCVADVSQGGRFVKTPEVFANFAKKAPNTGAIEGVVTNKDGNPVEGAKITAYGPSHASAESGPGGIYYMEVDKAGSYKVVPDDASVKKSSFDPVYQDVSVPKDGDATANFKLNSSVQVSINLSSTSVAASGYAVVTGTVKTTLNGQPDPGINLKLSVDPTDAKAALTTAPKVAICGPSGRIWPQGAITALTGKDVTVTTDQTGTYQFSLTVGTAPGQWNLDAWAYNEDGTLSTDVGDASETKTLDVTPVTPDTKLSSFVTELDSLKSTSIASQLTTNPGGLAGLLSTLKQGVQFGGLTFSVGQGTDGQNVIIAPATSQFVIGSDGKIQRSSSLLNDLVIDPQEWTGAGLPASVTNAASLQSVMQSGLLSDVPSVNAWESGGSGNPGWKLASNTLTDPSASLNYFGWAYPPSTSVPGYCN